MTSEDDLRLAGLIAGLRPSHSHEEFGGPLPQVYADLEQQAADELRGAYPQLTAITLGTTRASAHTRPGAGIYSIPGVHCHLLLLPDRGALIVRTTVPHPSSPASPHCCAVPLPDLKSGFTHLAALAQHADDNGWQVLPY